MTISHFIGDCVSYLGTFCSLFYFSATACIKLAHYDETTRKYWTFGQAVDFLNAEIVNGLKKIRNRQQPLSSWMIVPGFDFATSRMIPADVERIFEPVLACFSSTYLADYGYDTEKNSCCYSFNVYNFVHDIPDERDMIRYLEAKAESCINKYANTLYPYNKFGAIVAVSLVDSTLTVWVAQNEAGKDALKAYRDSQYVSMAQQAFNTDNAEDIEVD